MSLVSGLVNQTITSISSTVDNGYGDSVASVMYSSVPCRWQEKIGLILDKNNEEKQYRVEVWLTPDYTVRINYEVVYNNETYVVIGTEKRYGIAGNWDHTKLYLV